MSVSTLLAYALLLLIPGIVANPISTTLEAANAALQGPSTCWDGGQCRNPYSCSWTGVIVPCVKIDSTGEIVEASTGIVIAYLAGTSILADGTILLNDPIIPNLQPHAVGVGRDIKASEQTVETRRVAGEVDQKDRTSIALGKQVEKRHDYVMNCGDNNGPKYKRCSGFPYKYYCKSNGYLDNTGDDSPYCDDWCKCQEVTIKYCPFSNGVVQCVGIPIGAVVNQNSTFPNDTLPHDIGTKINREREAAEAVYSEVEPEPAAAEPAALTKRHNYALDCTSASTAVQNECKEFGYYCDSRGAVQAQFGRFVSCDVACKCHYLHTNCFVSRWDTICYKGMLVANANDVAPGTLAAQIINGTSVVLNNGTVLNDVQWA